MRRFDEHPHSVMRVFVMSGMLAACAYGATVRLFFSCIAKIWKAHTASPRIVRVLLACTTAHLVLGALNVADLAGVLVHSSVAVLLVPGLLQNALLLFRSFLLWQDKGRTALPSLVMLYCMCTGGAFIVFSSVRQYDDMRLMDGMALAGYRALHVLCSSFLCLFLSFVAFKPRTLITGNTPEKAASHSSRLSVFLEIPTLVLILVPLVPTAFVSTPIFLDLLPWVAQNQSVASLMITLRLVPEIPSDFKRVLGVFAPADAAKVAGNATTGDYIV